MFCFVFKWFSEDDKSVIMPRFFKPKILFCDFLIVHILKIHNEQILIFDVSGG
jgi:hypothetical protein